MEVDAIPLCLRPDYTVDYCLRDTSTNYRVSSLRIVKLWIRANNLIAEIEVFCMLIYESVKLCNTADDSLVLSPLDWTVLGNRVNPSASLRIRLPMGSMFFGGRRSLST
jgi:hypothetical protein